LLSRSFSAFDPGCVKTCARGVACVCVLNGFVMPSDIGNDKATNFSGSKYSTPTVHWKRSAETAVVGFGGLAGAAFHLPVRLLAHLLRAMQHIATR